MLGRTECSRVMSSVSDAAVELQCHVVRCEIGASVLETECPGYTDPDGIEQHQIPAIFVLSKILVPKESRLLNVTDSSLSWVCSTALVIEVYRARL